jgi:hypothetical protein
MSDEQVAGDGEPRDDQPGVHPVLSVAGWMALGYVGMAQLVLRLNGYVPRDLSMYARAARWWADGRSPYTQAFRVAGQDTLPFVYQPGTLPLFGSLSLVPEWAMSLLAGAWFVVGAGALVGATLYFRRVFTPQTPRLVAAGVVVAFFPAYFALTYGNMAVVLPLAAVGLHRLATGADRGERRLLGIGLGVLAAVKPYWLVSFGAVLVATRRWRALGWLGVGGVGPAIVTLWHWPIAMSWLQQLQSVDRLYWMVFTGPMTMVADGLLVAGWAALFGWWVRRDAPEATVVFVVGLSSVVVWPRVAPYSYLLALPALFYLAGRRGWRLTGTALLLASSPVVWGLVQLGIPALPRLFLYAWTAGLFGLVAADVHGRMRRTRYAACD